MSLNPRIINIFAVLIVGFYYLWFTARSFSYFFSTQNPVFSVIEMSVDGSILTASSHSNQVTVGGLPSIDEGTEVEHSYYEDLANGKKFQVTGIPRLDLRRW